jgi:hypothetical protein
VLTGFVTRVTTGATSRIGTAYPFGPYEFLVGFVCSISRVVFCRLLFVLFLYSHDIAEILLKVTLDTIKPILLLAIALSVLLWFTDYDYPFCIFKLFFSLKPRLCGFLTAKKKTNKNKVWPPRYSALHQ